MKHFYTLTILCLALASCGGQDQNQKSNESVTNSLPEHFFTTERPTDVLDLVDIKKNAKTGDEVTFLARIGGRKNGSFVPTLSMMIVADPNLLSCELMGEKDHCKTPEDYCCEDPESLTHGLGTIRFMENELDLYSFSVEGDHGMEVLNYVVINGTVNNINENGLFIVDANKVWVGGAPSYGHVRAGSGE